MPRLPFTGYKRNLGITKRNAMNTLLFILINGFLFSISSSSVTTNTTSNQSPVIQEDCSDKQPIPFVQPEFPQPQNNSSQGVEHEGIKQPLLLKGCLDSNAC